MRSFEQESILEGLVSLCALLARDWRSEERMTICSEEKDFYSDMISAIIIVQSNRVNS